MPLFYSLLLVFFTAPLWSSTESITLSAVKKGGSPEYGEPDNILDIVDIVSGRHRDAIAVATFTNSISENGWSFLHIQDTRSMSSPHRASDLQLAMVAGALEGNLTSELIDMHWQNMFEGYCDDRKVFCDRLAKFIDDNNKFCSNLFKNLTIAENYQVYLWYAQLRGLLNGYHGNLNLSYYDFLVMQLFGDIEDLSSALGGGGGVSSRVMGSGSCSALVKLLPGYEELYVAHDTWNDYSSMLRVFKRYNFSYYSSTDQLVTIFGSVQVFSSYPGLLHSGDDYYLINSGLVSMGTTIGNSNPDLWRYVTPTNLFEPLRVVVANRLAVNGPSWASYFSKHNMGTYNNQWMVVHYDLFEPGNGELQDGLLWISEQLPGTVLSSDQTDMLRTMSYWPSFNIPYQPSIFNLSGGPSLVEKYGDWFSWTGSPRAKIFARNSSEVTDLESMIALMRYNNFQEDVLSACSKCIPEYSAENAISARSDLNYRTGTYPFGALGYRSHGGTDMKVTSFELFRIKNLECVAVSSPTHDQQPVFQWSTSGFPDKHFGHPDYWNFDPTSVTWDF